MAKNNDKNEKEQGEIEEVMGEIVEETPAAPKTDKKTEPEPPPQPEKTEPTAEEKLAAANEKYLRLAAEYDNYRKRSAKERESIFAEVRSDTVTKFLPVYDNLARALAQETADEAYRKGVELIMTQLCEILKNLGVCEIEAVGKTFDPALHNAVMHIDDPEKGEGEIVLELQKGFRLGEKVIRFSVVQVAN